MVHLGLAREAVAPSLPAPSHDAHPALPCSRGDCAGSQGNGTQSGLAGPGSGGSGGGIDTATEAAQPAAVAEQRPAANEQRSSVVGQAGCSDKRQKRSKPPAAGHTAARPAAARLPASAANPCVIGPPAPDGISGMISPSNAMFGISSDAVRALFPAAATPAELPSRFTFAIGHPYKVGLPVVCLLLPAAFQHNQSIARHRAHLDTRRRGFRL